MARIKKKFSEFLFEEENHDIYSFISMVKSKCKTFISDPKVKENYLKGKFIYRGMDASSYIGDSDRFGSKIGFRKLHTEDRIRHMVFKDVRKNRSPKDSSQDHHKFFDEMFSKKFGVTLRSSSLFCTTNPEQASNYGSPFIIFPTGDNFAAFSSYSTADLYDNFFSTDNEAYLKVMNSIGENIESALKKHDLYFDKIESFFDEYIPSLGPIVLKHFQSKDVGVRYARKINGKNSISLQIAVHLFLLPKSFSLEDLQYNLKLELINALSIKSFYSSIESLRTKIDQGINDEPILNDKVLAKIEEVIEVQTSLKDAYENVKKFIEDNFDEIFGYSEMTFDQVFNNGGNEIMLVCDSWYGLQTIDGVDENGEDEEFLNIIGKIFS